MVSSVAVLSDIHGVLPALDAVLAEPAVREVFLGTEVTAALAGGSLAAPPAAKGDEAAGGERSEP